MPTWLSPPGSEMPVDERMPRHRIGRGRAGILDAVSVVARSKRQEDYSSSLTPTPPPFRGREQPSIRPCQVERRWPPKENFPPPPSRRGGQPSTPPSPLDSHLK